MCCSRIRGVLPPAGGGGAWGRHHGKKWREGEERPLQPGRRKRRRVHRGKRNHLGESTTSYGKKANIEPESPTARRDKVCLETPKCSWATRARLKNQGCFIWTGKRRWDTGGKKQGREDGTGRKTDFDLSYLRPGPRGKPFDTYGNSRMKRYERKGKCGRRRSLGPVVPIRSVGKSYDPKIKSHYLG